jgi:hypothetical protein
MEQFEAEFRTISTDYLVSLYLYELHNLDKASSAMAEVITIGKQLEVIQYALVDYLKAAECNSVMPQFMNN